MKRMYLVIGLITAIIFIELPVAVANQQDIIFVLDNSGSMLKSDPDMRIKAIVSTFIKQLDNLNQIGIIIFDESARLAVPLTLLDTPPSIKRLFIALDQINYHGQLTNTPDAIERAVYELRTKGRKDAQKSIVFLTDGIIDTGDARKDAEMTHWLVEDLTAECMGLGIKIFGVAFTEKADFHLIQSLSAKTNGGYYRALDADEISNALKDIIKLIVADTDTNANSTSEKTVTMLNSADQATNNIANMPPAEINNSDIDSTLSLYIRHLHWIIPVVVVISALSLLFFLIVKQKKIRRTQIPPEIPLKEDEFTDFQPEAQLLGINDTGNHNSEPHLLFFIDKRKVSIGRSQENSIVISESTISNFHATIQYVDGHFQLEDNHSTNGTFIENNRLAPDQPALLNSGDIIRFATLEFRFFLIDSDFNAETMIATEIL